MILFCDTSALVKLYLVESGSAALKQLLADTDAVAVCRMAWAEAHAAFARRLRDVPQDAGVIAQAMQALALDWPHFIILDVDQALVELAADYADTFALRGCDSVQLAAAHTIYRIAETPTVFGCFDARLNRAAKVLGLVISAFA
jgi:predicted nucleic acid-binding protein